MVLSRPEATRFISAYWYPAYRGSELACLAAAGSQFGKSVYIDKFKDLTEGPISVKLKGKSKEMVVYPLKKNLLAPISDSILL